MQLYRYQFSIRLTIFDYPITNLPFCYMLRVQAFEAADRIQFVESSNHVTEAELEVQLSGYCRICSDYIFARLYGSKPQLCHCSHCIGSKPSCAGSPQASQLLLSPHLFSSRSWTCQSQTWSIWDNSIYHALSSHGNIHNAWCAHIS